MAVSHPLEEQLRRGGADPRRFGPGEVTPGDAARLAENLAMVRAELDAPKQAFLARLLRRCRVPDLTVPVVTATPALRRSWFLAIAVSILFALSASGDQTAAGPDRIVVFLTLAPIIPVAGVALAFGQHVDPTHDLMLASPRDTFRVFLLRAVTVLGASAVLLLFGSLLLPAGGLYRLAWLLPSLSLTGLTLAASVGRDPRRIGGAVGIGWMAAVVIATQVGSTATAFGPVTQLAAVAVAVGSIVVLMRQRTGFEVTA